MITLSPYLVFNGNCEAAFNFYVAIIGGEIFYLGRYKEVPAETRKFFPNATDEQIMHGTYQLNPSITLMGNDNVDAYQQLSVQHSANFYLYLTIDNEAEAYRIFNALADSGVVTLPIAPTFWSTHYGIVTDKFGISWKITFESDANR